VCVCVCVCCACVACVCVCVCVGARGRWGLLCRPLPVSHSRRRCLQEAFDRRITFCLDVHNEAVKGMRYPPGAHRPDLESEEARREREKDEAALAQDIEDGKMDDDDDGGD
jgi:hypothetical protein